MMSLLNPILAQAAAIPEEITAGGVITAILFMLTAVGSMAMIAVWVVRYSQTGNALPAAQRGVLRVPWPLTLVGVALSVLFMLLMLLGSVAEMSGDVSNTVAASTTAESEEKATDADEKDSAASSTPSGISQEKMQDSLVQTIVMDLIMLLTFGVVVLVASQAGRVWLKEPVAANHQVSRSPVAMPHQSGRATNIGAGFASRWPDLDDAAATPQLQGYDFLRNRVLPETEQAPPEKAGELTAPQEPSSHQSPQQEQHIDEHNPFAVMHDAGRFESDPSAILLSANNPGSTAEPFSFVRELRFAAEVFLAAYLPTAALKLIIVLISVSIVGEPPKSHPFLEMLEAGVSVSMIATILIMAVFVAPIVEELQFRVVVLGGIAQVGWPKMALFGSSILFAFAHGFPDSIALIPLATGLGYTYLRRRCYVTVMLVHFLFNAFNMVLALVALL